MVKIFNILFLLLFCVGCASTPIRPIEFPTAQFEPTEKFELTETIKKPEKPKYVMLDSNYNITTDAARAAYIAFSETEFAKVVALTVAFDEQKLTVDSLVDVINVRIEEINALKELIATKEVLSKHLAQLYANEQQIRREEAKVCTMKDTANKILLFIQAGAIIALAIAL